MYQVLSCLTAFPSSILFFSVILSSFRRRAGHRLATDERKTGTSLFALDMWSALGHEPLSEHAAWHPEPSVRGTWSILSTCIITLGLCIWTAVHLNIPEHGTTQWTKFWRKVFWLFMGLLAPEIVSGFQAEPNREKCLTNHF